MKLTIVTDVLTPYRLPLFEAIRARVDDLAVLVMATQVEGRYWRLAETRLRTIVLPGIHVRPPGREVSVHINRGVVGALRHEVPDVVLSGGFAVANLQAFMFCKLVRCPYVAWGEETLRGVEASTRIRALVRRAIAPGCAGAIGSSREACDAFALYGVDRAAIQLAPMPIEVRLLHQRVTAERASPGYAARRASFGERVLLSVGRVVKSKGMDELLAIYSDLVRRDPGLALVIVGDGPDRPRYEKIVRGKGWNRVFFVGFVQHEDLAQWYAIADVFVFPTRFDAYGAVLVEAMASELAVAASIHAGATADLVENGVTGVRIEPRDTQGAAAAVSQLLDLTPDRRAALGRAAYARVRPCDTEETADAMVTFLRGIVAGQKPTRPR